MTTAQVEPVPLPGSCSVQWEERGLPATGSAPVARFWVALEQNGPWGHDAIAESHLPVEIGGALERAAQGAGGRLLLVRRPGEHADHHDPDASVTVLVSGGPPDRPWLLEGEIDDPAILLRLPWQSLGEDDPDAVTEHLPELEETRTVHLLVCTNGKRDVCCAVRGRPVAHSAAIQFPGQVWECSHTGGHRFAPTGILLPYGQVYARLTAELAEQVLTSGRQGQMPPALNNMMHNRGRSVWDDAGQAAEVTVRESIGELDLTALLVAPDEDLPRASDPRTARRVVSHRDGRTWHAQMTRVEGPAVKSSCAKAPKPTSTWATTVQ
ncbi:sucrase ferredoxin [Leekyejoonella antrihumi]|uniref:Sucrase ferredoxin n=1 Tax=Leekyejoonella antrihumi TaxID=1660198 RepID=A0A563E416_9MICO|nr:sucrase ferredoxin [Leekyejoonella antrihumi]TWP36951.1 sucrase ferredoxin [Leekyejoonella antrihumi]